MSRPSSSFPSMAPTPAPSSPPRSESFLSDLDGTAPSLLESADYSWEPGKTDSHGLNLVSWKLDVNARAEDGIEKRGFNAISTVLNHPTKKADPLRSSRKPLPALTQVPPTLPRPLPSSYYDPYLQTITPLYESFIATQSSASSARAESLVLNGNNAKEDLKRNLPPLASVPDLFFDPSFDLANPSTWESLVNADTESTEATDQTQDALASYLDTLERHLMHEITLRSSAFFAALSNLQDLHSESASCLTRITDLQTSLKDVGRKQAHKGLEIIDAQCRLHALRSTERNIKALAELDDLVKVAKGLVEAGDWSGGLSCLSDVVKWWDDHGTAQLENARSNGNLPLSTIPALSDLPETITLLTTSIATQLDTALSSLLLSVVTRDEDAQFETEPFQESVQPIMAGLVRCGQAGGVEDIWREAVTTAIRAGSRKHLPVSQSEEDEDDNRLPETRGAGLADSLKSMDHSTYLLLSTRMHSTMLDRLRVAQQAGSVLRAIMLETSDHAPIAISSSVPDTEASATNRVDSVDFNAILASACELANNRASKVLSVRSEQHAELLLAEFVEIFQENWSFVVATETLAQRMIVSLRGAAASQARAFLVTYHSLRLTKSATLVQEEQWTQIDVLGSVQHAVDLLIESAVNDPAECRIGSPSNCKAEESVALAKTISIEDKTFFVVKATAESLVLLADYLKIVINLGLVVTDVMSRIIEFLKSFNSRTCQVVLGAGAMRSAGLKNITAKHLALASQSLSVVVALIPYIREFIRRHLNAKQAVMLTEFDKLKRDYQEHQNEIHAKLVAIMSDRLAVHVGSLREIDWEITPPKDGPRQYAEMLVKETATLHKVLSKYLATSTVEGVLSEVLAAIVHRLSEEYAKIELKSDEGKKRMAQDAALLSSRLSGLSESGQSVSSLETLVREKSIPRRPIGQAMRGMLNRSSTSSGIKGDTVDGGNGTEADHEATEDGDASSVVEETVGFADGDTKTRVVKGDVIAAAPSPASALTQGVKEEASLAIEERPEAEELQAGDAQEKNTDVDLQQGRDSEENAAEDGVGSNETEEGEAVELVPTVPAKTGIDTVADDPNDTNGDKQEKGPAVPAKEA